jgi:hypothetical protein
MGSRLINVRLDEGHVRKVRKLRESGTELSDLVREAIDERFEQLNRRRTARDVQAILGQIFEQHPDPPQVRPLTYDVADRREARRAILRKLRRRR